jgi:hypothetical protein
MLAAVRGGGFREYFDPVSGAGRGSTDFSWSAALTLDVLAEQPAPAPVSELRHVLAPLPGTDRMDHPRRVEAL